MKPCPSGVSGGTSGQSWRQENVGHFLGMVGGIDISDVGKRKAGGAEPEREQRLGQKASKTQVLQMEATGAHPPLGPRLLVPSHWKSWMLRAGSWAILRSCLCEDPAFPSNAGVKRPHPPVSVWNIRCAFQPQSSGRLVRLHCSPVAPSAQIILPPSFQGAVQRGDNSPANNLQVHFGLGVWLPRGRVMSRRG